MCIRDRLWEEGYTVAAHQLGKFYRDDLSTLRDHEKAEQWFRRSADAGNDFSEYALGQLLLTQKRTVEAVYKRQSMDTSRWSTRTTALMPGTLALIRWRLPCPQDTEQAATMCRS